MDLLGISEDLLSLMALIELAGRCPATRDCLSVYSSITGMRFEPEVAACIGGVK